MDIQMVDLASQLSFIREEVDKEIADVIDSCQFIQGAKVEEFENALARFHNCKYAVSCGNGTDALQIALMALELEPGDEVIVPAFNYIATVEVISLLGLTPIMADVCKHTYNIDVTQIESLLSEKTRAIVPVHLFGQMADMDGIMRLAANFDLYVVEDNAQSIGASMKSSNKLAGTIGHIGCTSFFPSKNLGCFGDGGALTTNDESLSERIRMIANHGQKEKYYHEIVGINSRLDAIQAAVLQVKLKYLNGYNERRQQLADFYDSHLGHLQEIIIPFRHNKSTHVFHQYTLQVLDGHRDALKAYLWDHGIPSMIYYPKPLHKQNAYSNYKQSHAFSITEKLCHRVLSLPMHTEMKKNQAEYIVDRIKHFFT